MPVSGVAVSQSGGCALFGEIGHGWRWTVGGEAPTRVGREPAEELGGERARHVGSVATAGDAHDEPAVGDEHTPPLAERLDGVPHELEDRGRERDVEPGRGEWKVPDVGACVHNGR